MSKVGKTVQVRIPLTLYNEIRRIKREMERESKERFGKPRPITFVRAAQEYQRRNKIGFFGGKLI